MKIPSVRNPKRWRTHPGNKYLQHRTASTVLSCRKTVGEKPDCLYIHFVHWKLNKFSHFPLQEHHLQRAISAQQVFREKKESMVIPVPEAESNVNYYNRLYKGEFKQPKQFIHIQREFRAFGDSVLPLLGSPDCLEGSEIHLEVEIPVFSQVLEGSGSCWWRWELFCCWVCCSGSAEPHPGLQIFLIQPHLLWFFLPCL